MFTELENPEKLFGLLQGWLISAHSSYISQRRKSCGICQNKNTNEAKKSTQKARQRKKKRASTNNNVSRQSNHLRQLLPPSTHKKTTPQRKKNVANKIIKTPTKFRSTPLTPRPLVLWSARGGRMIDGWWPLNCDVEICVKLSKTYIFFASWHFKLRPQRNFTLHRLIVLLQADTDNSVLYTGRVILLKRS